MVSVISLARLLHCVKLMGEPQKYIYFSPNVYTFEIEKRKQAKFFWRIASLTFRYILDIFFSENYDAFFFK